MRVAASTASPSRFTWWSAGPASFELGLERPALASWDAAGSASQLRLARFRDELAPAVTAVEAVPAPRWLALEVVLPVGEDLLQGRDVENYLTPLVAHLGPSAFVLVIGHKRTARYLGDRSRLTLGTAVRGAPPPAAVGVRLRGSAGHADWKTALRSHLIAAGVAAAPDGPLAMALAFRCTPEGRNWVNLWKAAGDALGPILGEPRPDRPFHPADDRVVSLALHLGTDPTLGWDVEVAVASQAAAGS